MVSRWVGLAGVVWLGLGVWGARGQTVAELRSAEGDVRFADGPGLDPGEASKESRRERLEVVTLYDKPVKPFSAFGVALKISTLGPGLDLVTPLLRNWNLRASATFLNFGHTVENNGVFYDGELRMRSGQVGVDWFPRHGGFHLSGGLLVLRPGISGMVGVPGGGTYTLDDVTYVSNPADPIRGEAEVTFSRRVSPTLTIGFGNILPRSGKHITVPVEIGAAYVGAARIGVRLAGSACQNGDCFDVATDPDSQQNLNSDLADYNQDLKRYQVLPLFSIGVGYRF